jgi:hypothetical protein
MRNRKAAGVDADVEARIAQIEQMTLEELAAFQSRVMTEIITGKITPREGRTIDRAVGERLKAIEQELRRA